MSYAPYPAYKDSGVPWLGQVPERWDAVSIRRVAKKVQTGGTPPSSGVDYFQDGQHLWYTPGDFWGDLELSISSRKVNKRAIDDQVVRIFPSRTVYVVGIGTIGRVGFSASPSSANQQINAIIPSDRIETKFLAYSLAIQTSQMIAISNATILGIMNQDKTKQIRIAVPPIEEQTAIADFLDKKTAEIDGLIAKQEELLRLLAEQRTALITHAVTKGLNSNAPMKPSGIDWLGDVPEGWEIRPISTAIQKLESGVSVNAMDVPAEHDQQGVLKTSAVYSGSFDPTQNKLIYDPVEAERLACPVRKGELIISRMNTPDLVGAVGIVEDEYPNLFLPDRLWQTRFWNQATANAPFLYYFLNSKLFRAVIASLASGTSGSMQNITQSDLMKIKIGMPPLSEQSQIVDFLDQALDKLDATRAKTDEAIKTLREYRTALITNAVTGKIKVA